MFQYFLLSLPFLIIAIKRFSLVKVLTKNLEQFHCEIIARLLNALKASDPAEKSLSSKNTRVSDAKTSKLENAQPASNVDQLKPTPDSVLQRLQVLEDILCSNQKSLTESQAIAKVNDLVEATKVMESTLTNLQEKYVDLHAKQSNYKIVIANMNRVKKNQQLLGSRLELLEKKEEQERKDEDNSGTIKQSLEPRISLLEEALFSVQAFEPNTKLMHEMKELSEKNKALEVKIKFLQKKLADTHANEIVLRVDLDKLDCRTVCTREELDSFSSKTTTRISALEGKIDSIIPDNETDNQEHSSINDTVSPPQ